jgi:soluble lytic murein transglycosylase-like protein
VKPDPGLVTLARQIAVKHGLNDALVCAIVEQESGWQSGATRYEPAFYEHYIVPLSLNPNEGKQRATSYGLMQTMLQSVVEIGYQGDGPGLCDPATGLDWGCRLLVKKMLRAGGDQHMALLYWNGGGNPLYPGQVIDRIPRYIQPIEWADAGEQVDSD